MARDRGERFCVVIPRRSSLALALVLFHPFIWRAAEFVVIITATRFVIGAIGLIHEDMAHLRARKQAIEERAGEIDRFLQQVSIELDDLKVASADTDSR